MPSLIITLVLLLTRSCLSTFVEQQWRGKVLESSWNLFVVEKWNFGPFLPIHSMMNDNISLWNWTYFYLNVPWRRRFNFFWAGAFLSFSPNLTTKIAGNDSTKSAVFSNWVAPNLFHHQIEIVNKLYNCPTFCGNRTTGKWFDFPSSQIKFSPGIVFF